MIHPSQRQQKLCSATMPTSATTPIRQPSMDDNDRALFDPLEPLELPPLVPVAVAPFDVAAPLEELAELLLVPFVVADGNLVIVVHEAPELAAVPGLYGRYETTPEDDS